MTQNKSPLLIYTELSVKWGKDFKEYKIEQDQTTGNLKYYYSDKCYVVFRKEEISNLIRALSGFLTIKEIQEVKNLIEPKSYEI